MLSVRFAVMALFVVGLLGVGAPAMAQMPGVPASGGSEEASAEQALDTLSGRLTPAQIDAQLAGLTDEEIRELFRLQLRRSAVSRSAQESLTFAEQFQKRLELPDPGGFRAGGRVEVGGETHR